MSLYEDFTGTLLPGNYALTKSMELTKKDSSGTLWYTKKFLVLYYYIFLTDDIFTKTYIKEATAAFDHYIETMYEDVKETAHQYFYPDNPGINMKDPAFKTFAAFAGKTDFETKKERQKYIQDARKYYFALLMGSGGQSGVKKSLKEYLSREQFAYSQENIKKALKASAIRVCVKEGKQGGQIRDNSLKYLLSEKAMEELRGISQKRDVTAKDVKEIMEKYPHPAPNFLGIANDMPAFIRNERQILYYYGYFHSKTTGAQDFEFSSLTPVGELALRANDTEFLALWEHQKIKMISQPPVVELTQIGHDETAADAFALSFTPYSDILSHLHRNETLTLEQYQYIVSRKKWTIPQKAWEKGETQLLSRLPDIKNIVAAFGRQSDHASNDSRKELLKYILGIRRDLPRDASHNPLNLCRFGRDGLECVNKQGLTLLYKIYGALDAYKQTRYGSLFALCEKDLKRRYKQACNGKNVLPAPDVKIQWDLYNIHVDSLILLGVILAISCNALRIFNIKDLTKEDWQQIAAYAQARFAALAKHAGINSKNSVDTKLKQAYDALRQKSYGMYLPKQEEHKAMAAAYREHSGEALRQKIMQLSNETGTLPERKRNTALVDCLKAYYMKLFSENETLRCECCGKEAFLTAAGEPYVEFHHLIPFGLADGPDHYLNLFALCACCHRKLHYMSAADKKQPYAKMAHGSYLQQDFTQRLSTLKEQKLLRSYQMEYLLADNAVTEQEYCAIMGA